jgi:hypothetical protein
MAANTITLGGAVRDDDGDPRDLVIAENELAAVTDDELAEWGISRTTLHRCFAEGVALMKDKTESDRVRPIAEHVGEGLDDWEVVIVGYSEFTDPLMDEPKGSA